MPSHHIPSTWPLRPHQLGQQRPGDTKGCSNPPPGRQPSPVQSLVGLRRAHPWVCLSRRPVRGRRSKRVGPSGESRVLAAGPTPAPLRATPDPTSQALGSRLSVRVADTAMIPQPSAIPPHPPSRHCGLWRAGVFVCGRTYRWRPRNTRAAAGIPSISLSGATTRRTNLLSPLVYRCFAGGAQTDRTAPASRAVLSDLQHRNSRRADGRTIIRIHPSAATFRHRAHLGVRL